MLFAGGALHARRQAGSLRSLQQQQHWGEAFEDETGFHYQDFDDDNGDFLDDDDDYNHHYCSPDAK